MWRVSGLLRLLLFSCVALAAVPIFAATVDDSNAGDPRFFDFAFISKECGPKTACDCESSNDLCSAEEIMKYCEVCKGDLDIDYRFKGFTAFWMLKEVTGDMILHKEAVDVKAIELPQLKTIGGGMYLGGSKGNNGGGYGGGGITTPVKGAPAPPSYGSPSYGPPSCPYKFEYLNAPKLATVGTVGKGVIQVGGYPKQVGTYPTSVGKGVETASKGGGGKPQYVYTKGCPNLYKFNTPSLTYVGHCVSFVNNNVLQTLAFPHLKGVGISPKANPCIPGSVTIMGNDELKLYHAPKALQHTVMNGTPRVPVQPMKPEYYIRGNPKLKLAVVMNNDYGKFNVDLTQNKDKAMALYTLPERKEQKYSSGGLYYDEFPAFDAFDLLPKGGAM